MFHLCLSVSLLVTVLFACQPACLSICLPAYLHVCLPACLSAASLSVCMPAYHPTRKPLVFGSAPPTSHTPPPHTHTHSARLLFMSLWTHADTHAEQSALYPSGCAVSCMIPSSRTTVVWGRHGVDITKVNCGRSITLLQCTHTCTCTSAGTLHRVRGLFVRPFSITPPCRQSYSVFGGFYLRLRRMRFVMSGAYHGCKKSTHNKT